jgi:5-methylcytosine-specific restriction endonuclease McrA
MKLISQFGKDSHRKDNLYPACKLCEQKRLAIYRKKYHFKLKKYYQKNKEKILKKQARYCKRNKKRIYQYHKKYSLTAEGIYSTLKHYAPRRKIYFNLSRNDFINWYNRQSPKCSYCLRDFKTTVKSDYLNQKARRLTIDRKNNEKGYSINNLALACRRCNNIKGDYFTYQEMLKIGKIIYSRHIKKEYTRRKFDEQRSSRTSCKAI